MTSKKGNSYPLKLVLEKKGINLQQCVTMAVDMLKCLQNLHECCMLQNEFGINDLRLKKDTFVSIFIIGEYHLPHFVTSFALCGLSFSDYIAIFSF